MAKLLRRMALFARPTTVAALLVLGSGGCNLSVTNPGPIPDKDLNNPAMFASMVNGMGRDLAEGLNSVAHGGAAVTRELQPAAYNQIFSVSSLVASGKLDPNDGLVATAWETLQQARWAAESGLVRFKSVLGQAAFSKSQVVAQAYLWAGYANRTLGENMCQAVIDGGPAMPREEYFIRADSDFTNAMAVATAAGASDIAMAAQAGRAAVRVQMGNWDGAVADAGAVPTNFVYSIPYYDVGDRSEYNEIAYATQAQPYKTLTVWGTKYEAYYENTHDPRTPWVDTGLKVDGGALSCCGIPPFYQQKKFTSRTSSINLSSGREMRLIEAENDLRNSQLDQAIALINGLRDAVGAPEVQATTIEDGWTLLKRERGIELWLEGRRLGDMYRWAADNTPGALDPLEQPGAASHLDAQDLCFPIPTIEITTNPNLP